MEWKSLLSLEKQVEKEKEPLQFERKRQIASTF